MKLLPIGSVVKLEGVEPIIMIIGRMVISTDNCDFVYVGVLCPVGYLGDEKYCASIMIRRNDLLV